jgi:hypothetical protein
MKGNEEKRSSKGVFKLYGVYMSHTIRVKAILCTNSDDFCKDASRLGARGREREGSFGGGKLVWRVEMDPTNTRLLE